MPMLPAEPCCFPESLFVEPDPPEGESWWVLHTRPRTEKAVARSLHHGRVAFFLPLYEQSRRVGGRVLTSHLPLFDGYLFLRAGEEGRLRALETNQIANCIRVPDQVQLREQLAAVHIAMTSGSPIGPAAKLLPGTTVTITRGPLLGLKGKVLRSDNRLRLILEVQMLSQGVSVEIESWMVESLLLEPKKGEG